MHDIFNYTLASYNTTFLRLHRQWINTTSPTSSIYKGADLYLTVPENSTAQLSVTPGDNGAWTPPTVDILVPPGSSEGIVTVAVVTNETSLAGLNTEGLFLPESTNGTQALQTALVGLADGNSTAAQQVSPDLTTPERTMFGFAHRSGPSPLGLFPHVCGQVRCRRMALPDGRAPHFSLYAHQRMLTPHSTSDAIPSSPCVS